MRKFGFTDVFFPGCLKGIRIANTMGRRIQPGSASRRGAAALATAVGISLYGSHCAAIDLTRKPLAMPLAVDWEEILVPADTEKKSLPDITRIIFGVAWALGYGWHVDTETPSNPGPRAIAADSGDLDGPPVPVPFGFSGSCAPQRVVAVHPNQRLVFFATSGGTQGFVCAYRLDPVARVLSPAPGSPYSTGGAPADALAIDPSGTFLYSVAADDSTVVAFAIDATTGTLTRIGTFTTPPTPLAIVADPTGRFVYVATQANKTAASTIAGYAVDPPTGALALLPGSPYPVPNGAFVLAMDPLGRFVYLTAENGVQSYAIDAATGALAPRGAAVPGSGKVAVDPSGRSVYVEAAEFRAPNLVEGVRTYTVGADGALAAVGGLITVGATGVQDLVASRSGRRVYVVTSQERADFSGFDYAIATLKRDEATGVLAPIAGSPLPIGATRALAPLNVLPSQSGWAADEPMYFPLGVSGGYPPYNWSVASGTVPSGLGVDAKLGALRGTPTVPGTYDFVVQVTDSRGALATKPYHFTVIGAQASAPVPVVEFYNQALDHYFITWVPDEIAKLDAGTTLKGWTRTGETFKAYATAQTGTSPVCRYYIPPNLGDSHFFGRGTTECTDTGHKNPSFVQESADFMQMFLPAVGACPANATPVYRVFSNRADANHRYMTSKATRDLMVGKGWIAEGDGPDLVVMCAPQS